MERRRGTLNKTKKNDRSDEILASEAAASLHTSVSPEEDEPAADDTSTETEHSAGMLAILMREIQEGNRVLSEKIDSKSAQLQTSIDGVKSTLDGLLTRVNEAEQRISSTEDTVNGLDLLAKQLKKDNEFLKNKMDQLENYSRRNNVRIVGLREDSEGQDPVKFFTEWIPSVLGADGPVEIERAHRTLNPKPRSNEPPRPVLIRLLRFQDREKILRLARAKGNITVDGKKVSFFPDMSPDLARRRKQLVPALKAIKEKGITCYLIYPARLKIQCEGGRIRLFDTAGEALRFLEEVPRS